MSGFFLQKIQKKKFLSLFLRCLSDKVVKCTGSLELEQKCSYLAYSDSNIGAIIEQIIRLAKLTF